MSQRRSKASVRLSIFGQFPGYSHCKVLAHHLQFTKTILTWMIRLMSTEPEGVKIVIDTQYIFGCMKSKSRQSLPEQSTLFTFQPNFYRQQIKWRALKIEVSYSNESKFLATPTLEHFKVFARSPIFQRVLL